MNIVTLIVVPVSGAIIGYFTNWLAIKMLFRPYHEKKILGFKLPFTPGLIAKGRFELSKKLGAAVSQNVLTPEVLNAVLVSDEISQKIDGFIETLYSNIAESDITVEKALSYLSDSGDLGEDIKPKILEEAKRFVGHGKTEAWIPKIAEFIGNFSESNPELDNNLKKMVADIAAENFGRFIGIFINYDKIYGKIKNGIIEYLLKDENAAIISQKLTGFLNDSGIAVESILSFNIGEYLRGISDETRERLLGRVKNLAHRLLAAGGPHLASALDFGRIIEDKINGFEAEDAEKLIVSVVRRELKAITLLGGVLGFIMGLITVLGGFFWI